ncbi:MAG: MerR family transcriptional regulator [Sneathiella sp.]|nr:MerR family transcriptional regulator [Sneathiella sp.]
MYIGEISKKTGLSIKAIRLYEELDLIPKPKRSGTYRVYEQPDIEILKLIKEAKVLGVTLSQIRSFLFYENGVLDWGKVKIFLFEKKKELREEIQKLHEKIHKIDDCLDQMGNIE